MRSMTTAFRNEILKNALCPILLVQIHVVSGDQFYWTGIGPITWNGHTWTGTGTLGGISVVSETQDTKATNITLSLSGIPNSLISVFLSECRQDAPATIWFGSLNSSGGIIADPLVSFAGRVDVPSVDEGADKSILSVTVESSLSDLQRARASRYTQDDQQLVSAGDMGFNMVASLQTWTGVWGKR